MYMHVCFFAAHRSLVSISKHQKANFTRWEDIDIFAQGGGRFRVVLTIKHLKDNPHDPEKGEHRMLECHMDSPHEDNINFSIPHRLLVIALRRNLLEGIDNIDDLMSTDLEQLTIKEQFLRDPIFLIGRPGGRGIDTSDTPAEQRAMSAISMTTYLRDTGRGVGYTAPITLYPFRRRTATDLVTIIGEAATRRAMGHDPATCESSIPSRMLAKHTNT